MASDHMNYDQMVEEALRQVPRIALLRVAQDGLKGNHHIYVSFRMAAPGVAVPKHLRERYPDEMTIVLQHRFNDLDVGEDEFSVTLYFNRTPERMTIPFAAITSFADPSVQFGLQFRVSPIEPTEEPARQAPPPARLTTKADTHTETAAKPAKGAADHAAEKAGQVVALDTFRKK